MVSEKVCVETFGGDVFCFFVVFLAFSFSSKKMGGRLSWACFFFVFLLSLAKLALILGTFIFGSPTFPHFSAEIGQLKLHPWHSGYRITLPMTSHDLTRPQKVAFWFREMGPRRFQGNRSVGEILTKWPDCIKAHQNKLHELIGA